MSRPAATIHSRPDTAEIGLATVAPKPARVVLAALRVVLGFYFLWAFVDELFGFGFHTAPEKAWINGPFHAIAGAAWADWLFMAGLLGIGVALILGIGSRIATVSAVLLLAMMYLASFPLETNPIVDDHVVYALAIAALGLLGAGDVYGFGRWWKALPIVQRHHWLT